MTGWDELYNLALRASQFPGQRFSATICGHKIAAKIRIDKTGDEHGTFWMNGKRADYKLIRLVLAVTPSRKP